MGRAIRITDPREAELMGSLERRDDFEALRIRRLLQLPDLTRTEHSPVKFIVDAIVRLPRFQDFDLLEIPRIVSTEDNFDVLNTPADHPSRRTTDTYYVTATALLRTHTTTMWPYYVRSPSTKERLARDGMLRALCFGSVYRKDEIDRHHYPVFHQIDGLYVCSRSKQVLTLDDLAGVLADIVRAIYGPDVEWRVIPDAFPFTHPSLQVEVRWKGNWMEVLGAGLVHEAVLRNFDFDPAVYNGWAFGFGVDRLAMIKMGIPDIRILWSNDPRIQGQFRDLGSLYREVSKYPSIIRDISFVVAAGRSLNEFYEIVREEGGDLVEEVRLLDTFRDEKKFGKGKISHTFRVTYRSHERTLTNEEVNRIQDQIVGRAKTGLQAIIR